MTVCDGLEIGRVRDKLSDDKVKDFLDPGSTREFWNVANRARNKEIGKKKFHI
jgi:hypothetical protein